MSTTADLAAREASLATAVQAETQALADLKTVIDKGLADIQAEVDALKNAQPSLDLTSLDSSISALQANLGSIQLATSTVAAADPGPQPPPPPPPTV